MVGWAGEEGGEIACEELQLGGWVKFLVAPLEGWMKFLVAPLGGWEKFQRAPLLRAVSVWEGLEVRVQRQEKGKRK